MSTNGAQEVGLPKAATVKDLFRYPVKGLSPQPDVTLPVTVDDGVPGDRRFALALGSTRFDPDHPEPLDKGYFLMLRRDASLAALRTDVDGDSLTVTRPDGTLFTDTLATPEGRAAIEGFFQTYLDLPDAERPRLVTAAGHKFTDVSVISPVMMRAVSLINLASVDDLAIRYGRAIHPLRFRANIYIEGLAPWAEFDWVGREVSVGGLRFRCVLRTKRCAAVDVEPGTGLRDMALPKALMQTYGHPDCGVYLEVLSDGSIAIGDAVVPRAS